MRQRGRPRKYTLPLERLQIRATFEELQRVRQLSTRQRAEVLLAECDRLAQPDDVDEIAPVERNA